MTRSPTPIGKSRNLQKGLLADLCTCIQVPAASARGAQLVDLLLRRQLEHVVGTLLDYLELKYGKIINLCCFSCHLCIVLKF